MGHAVRHQAYEGVVVFGSGSHLSMAHVVHRFHDGEVQEQLESLDGSAREIYRDGDKVVSIVPRKHLMFVAERAGRRAASAARHRLRHHLTRYYQLSLDGRGRVAGRPCQNLEASAKDRYRYDYDFCLDEKTALPLSIQILSQQGKLLEQVVFSSIRFPASIPDSALTSNVNTSHFRQMNKPQSGAGKPPVPQNWQIAALPPGFQVVLRDRRWLPGVNHAAAHILCSDGLASVSVFISPLSDGVPALHGALGAFNAYASVVGKDRVTVVGEVPQATLRFISEHVTAVSAAGSGAQQPSGPAN